MTTSASPTTIRRLGAGALLVVLLTCLAGSLPILAGTASAATLSTDEQDYVARINQLRASVGVGPLAIDDNMTDLARAQTERMAGEDRLFHTPNLAAGVTSDWANLGENVGTGSNTAIVFDAFVKSPHHYENLVNPAFTHVGVTVITKGNLQWTTHRFMTKRSPVSVPPAPQPVAETAEPEPAPAPQVIIPAPAPAPAPVVVVPAPAPRPQPVPVPTTVAVPRPTTTVLAPVVPVALPVIAPVPTPADPVRVDMMVVALHAF